LDLEELEVLMQHGQDHIPGGDPSQGDELVGTVFEGGMLAKCFAAEKVIKGEEDGTAEGQVGVAATTMGGGAPAGSVLPPELDQGIGITSEEEGGETDDDDSGSIYGYTGGGAKKRLKAGGGSENRDSAAASGAAASGAAASGAAASGAAASAAGAGGSDPDDVDDLSTRSLVMSRAKRQKNEPKRYTPPVPMEEGATRATRSPIENFDYCYVCNDGGDLISCDQCPMVYHLRCVGLDTVPKGVWRCPWHSCWECDRRASACGGMIFHCTMCPRAYCFDCAPDKYLNPEEQLNPGAQKKVRAALEQHGCPTKNYLFFTCHQCEEELRREAKAAGIEVRLPLLPYMDT